MEPIPCSLPQSEAPRSSREGPLEYPSPDAGGTQQVPHVQLPTGEREGLPEPKCRQTAASLCLSVSLGLGPAEGAGSQREPSKLGPDPGDGLEALPLPTQDGAFTLLLEQKCWQRPSGPRPSQPTPLPRDAPRRPLYRVPSPHFQLNLMKSLPWPLGLEEVQEVRTLGESSAPSLRSVTLGEVYNFSGPQFLYL